MVNSFFISSTARTDSFWIAPLFISFLSTSIWWKNVSDTSFNNCSIDSVWQKVRNYLIQLLVFSGQSSEDHTSWCFHILLTSFLHLSWLQFILNDNSSFLSDLMKLWNFDVSRAFEKHCLISHFDNACAHLVEIHMFHMYASAEAFLFLTQSDYQHYQM